MTLWLALFAATWAVYLALAARCARKNLLEAVEILIVIAGSSIGFFSRTVLGGTSTTLGALRGAGRDRGGHAGALGVEVARLAEADGEIYLAGNTYRIESLAKQPATR